MTKSFLTTAISISMVSLTAMIIIVPPPMPSSKDDCKKGGWEQYGVFKNQGDCVSYVATDGRNAPAL